MSMIESAYLKALKKSKIDIEQDNSSDPLLRGHNSMKGMPDIESEETSSSPVTQQKQSTSEHVISKMSQQKKYTDKELQKHHIISANSPDLSLVNQFRNLRTNLLSSQKSSNFVTLITSVVDGFDTGLIATNIAASFALDSNKTSLLINADTLHDDISTVFGVQPDIGIIDYLESSELSVNNILYETPVPRMRYIPCGKRRDNASEYFTSQRMKQLINKLLSRYPERYPIINSSSISSSADTRILLDSCDCVVLIVPYGKCTENDIDQAMKTVGSDKFAGIVLDGF